MKSRNMIIGVSALVIIVSVGVLGNKFLNLNANNEDKKSISEINTEKQDTDSTDLQTEKKEAEMIEVTTFTPGDNLFDDLFTGKVKSDSKAKITPSAQGQVSKIFIKKGDKVNKDQVIAEISGTNNTRHPYLVQLDMAMASLQAATTAVNASEKASNSATNVAAIQSDSAYDQTLALSDDLDSIRNSIENLDSSIEKAEENFYLFQDKSKTDLFDLTDKLSDLKKDILYANEEKNNLVTELNSLLNSGTIDEETNNAIEAKKKLLFELDGKILGLESAKEAAEKGQSAFVNSVETAENATITQINQLKTQRENLYLTLESTQKKAGYSSNLSESTGVRLANENYLSTLARNELTLAQTYAQLANAKSGLEMAKNQAEALKIKSTIDGFVNEVNIKEGELVGPQSILADIIGKDGFEAEILAEPDIANLLSKGLAKGYMMFGETPYELKFIGGGLTEEGISGKVKISFELPKLAFRENQEVKIKVLYSSLDNQNSVFVPLDAVVIGTEEKYLFVRSGETARKVAVEIGEIKGDLIEIRSGVSFGETIIVKNAKNLTDGSSIRII